MTADRRAAEALLQEIESHALSDGCPTMWACENAKIDAILAYGAQCRAEAQQERDELAAWKAEALISLAQWHALGDALLPFAPEIIVGENIPSGLTRIIPDKLTKP